MCCTQYLKYTFINKYIVYLKFKFIWTFYFGLLTWQL